MTHCAINQLGSKTTIILISHQKSTLPGLVSLASHLSDTDRCETVGDKARILCGEGGRGLCGNSENKS